jgi:nitrogen fixation protein FixH
MTASKPSGKHWPVIIVALLLGNVTAVMVLIGSSRAGESHHVVPDYYEKAVAWDQTMAQERANLDLGWSVEVTPGTGGELVLTVRDRAGAPVEGATIQIDGFHRANASSIVRALAADRGEGRYVALLPIARAGLWQLELTATRGPAVFTRTLVRDLAPAEQGGA